MGGLALAEQTPNDFGSTFPPWAQLSAAVVLVVLLVLGLRALYAFANGAYKREVERADACQRKYDDLAGKVIEQYVPALTKASEAMAEVITEIRAIRAERPERRR